MPLGIWLVVCVSYSNAHWRRVEPDAVPLGCPMARAKRLLSEERSRLFGEWVDARIAAVAAAAAAPQVEPFLLPRSRG